MRSSKYDAATLAPLVESSRSFSEVLRKLGLPTTGGNHRMIVMRIRLAGLDTSHFVYGRGSSRLAAVPASTLADLVKESRSVAQVLQKLNLPLEGRPHHEMRRHLERLRIDTSHFRGQGWSRGETKASHASVARIAKRNSYSDAEVFVENSPLAGSGLVRRLLAIGWAYRCSWCGISEWRGAPLTLHLDHVNGINNDNRLSNLRLLCPNCHAQTDTYCGRNRSARH